MTKKRKTKAYSYLRFSTPEQSKGDSFRRQSELSQRYADSHNLELDNSLTFHDLGVSAFKGKNASDGALKAFHDAVDDGRVAKGAYLLVESLDRLSRDTVWKAVTQLADILKRGITVVTLQDDRKFTHESLENPFELMASIMVMARAHEESATKSKRLSHAWANKRKRGAQEGHKLTSLCPAWLELVKGENGSQEFRVIKERAAVVKRIYDMLLDGIGKRSIARTFNEEGLETFGCANGWHDSYIQKISETEAVCGTFQPHRMQEDEDTGKRYRVPDGNPIHDYFPAVIDRPTYLRARAARRARVVPAGNRGKAYSNLFSGFINCGSCGAPMHYVNKGGGRKGGTYLACSSVRRKVGDCKMKSWRYPAVEQAVLVSASVRFSDAMPAIAQRAQGDLKALQDERLELVDDIDRLVGRIDTAVELLLDMPSDALKAKLEKMERQKDDLQGSLESLDTLIQKTQSRSTDQGNQEALEQIYSLLSWMHTGMNGAEDEQYRHRAKLAASLKQQGIMVALVSESVPDELEDDLHGLIRISIGGQSVGGFLMNKGQHDGVVFSLDEEKKITFEQDGLVWPLDAKGQGYDAVWEMFQGTLGKLKETG